MINNINYELKSLLAKKPKSNVIDNIIAFDMITTKKDFTKAMFFFDKIIGYISEIEKFNNDMAELFIDYLEESK